MKMLLKGLLLAIVMTTIDCKKEITPEVAYEYFISKGIEVSLEDIQKGRKEYSVTSKLNDDELIYLKAYPKLDSLTFGEKITDKGIESIQFLKGYKSIELGRSKITSNALQFIDPDIEELVISFDSKISKVEFKGFDRFKKLKHLYLRGIIISKELILEINQLTKLNEINLGIPTKKEFLNYQELKDQYRVHNFSDFDSIEDIDGLKNIKHKFALRFVPEKNSVAKLEKLLEITNIQDLIVYFPNISDEEIEVLKKFTHLRELTVTSDNLKEMHQYDEFKNAMQGVQITLPPALEWKDHDEPLNK